VDLHAGYGVWSFHFMEGKGREGNLDREVLLAQTHLFFSHHRNTVISKYRHNLREELRSSHQKKPPCVCDGDGDGDGDGVRLGCV